MERFVNEIARDVIDPQKQISVAERLRARLLVVGGAEEKRMARERPDFRIRALGSGSDYTPFLQHLGIAALDIRFGGEGDGGSYHSAYDSYDHYTRFIDPGFDYGIALAQTSGRAVLRLAQSDVLPFEFGNFTETVTTYVKDIIKLTDEMRAETSELNQLIADKTLERAADPTRPFRPPAPKPPVPHLNFAPLQNAIQELQESSKTFEAARRHATADNRGLSLAGQRALDERLMRCERLLTHEEGLPRRPWYKHMIYAPGFYTGYNVKTLPGVREAIEERQWDEVDRQIGIVAGVLVDLAKALEEATAVVKAHTTG
jgi:N-acetylated-alpha-linked acidic dipeptidase